MLWHFLRSITQEEFTLLFMLLDEKDLNGQGPHFLPLYIKHGAWHTMETTNVCGTELEA